MEGDEFCRFMWICGSRFHGNEWSACAAALRLAIGKMKPKRSTAIAWLAVSQKKKDNGLAPMAKAVMPRAN